LVYKSLTWDTPLTLTEALFLDDVFLLVALVRLNVGHNLTTHDDLDELRQVLAPDISHLSIKRTNAESVDESRVALAQKNETACSRREIETKHLRNKAIAMHSRHPLPADRRYGLLSTWRRWTEPRTQATRTKIGKDRACGSGDILAARETDTQTDIHHNTSQPFPQAK